MPRSIYNTAERSEETQELINRVPGWMVNWGTLVVAALIAGIILASWAISYPDVVQGSFRLSAQNKPKSIFTRGDGKLMRLFVRNGMNVKQGQTLAYLESATDHDAVLKLDSVLETIFRTEDLTAGGHQVLTILKRYDQLGELQLAVQTFLQSTVEWERNGRDSYYGKKRGILENELQDLRSLAVSLKKQQDLHEREQQLAVEEYSRDQKLAEKRIIAPNELKQAESRKLLRMLPYEQAAARLIENSNSQKEKQKELLELDDESSRHRIAFQQHLNTLRSAVSQWKARYVIAAPMSGIVYFPSVVQENQYLPNGRQVFDVVPSGNGYLGELYLPQENFGKIKLKQDVLIKFAGYPFQQFGFVRGKVLEIADVPAEDTVFLVKVSLPNGLRTIYGHHIPNKPGLMASGEVITEDARLLQRLFYQLRKTAPIK